MWRCFRRAPILSARGAAVRPRGACGAPQLQLPAGTGGARWPPAGGVGGMLHRTGIWMAPPRPKWTLASRVEDVLFGGEGEVPEVELSDVPRSELGGRGVVAADENVSLESVLAQSEAVATDEDDLGLTLASPSYTTINEAIEDARRLAERGVGTLHDWRGFAQKDVASPTARTKLDAALAAAVEAEGARQGEKAGAERGAEVARRRLPEDLYGSVLNASWSHVVGFPEVDEYEEELVRMEVKEGQRPTKSWKYKPRGLSFELDDAVEQFRPPRPRLMVLSSEKGWPYSLREGTDLTDCYVTAEAERVWKRLDVFLRVLFRRSIRRASNVRRVLLLGTPGMGQSMTVGSYLLYRLLHYDARKFQVAVYCFGGELAYVFDKTTQTVTEHEGADSIIAVLDDLARRGKKGYIIYDVSEEGAPPSSKLPPDGWGMILLASLKSGNFNTLAMQLHTSLTIMNCPDEKEVKAMCAWRTRGRPAQEQRKYWETVQDRMSQVGPMPRYILTEADFNEGTEVVNSALQAIDASVARDYFDLEEGN
ncbi:putative retrotransposon hot spot (RHS) protein, partial [Trypanosoma conorhini]